MKQFALVTIITLFVIFCLVRVTRSQELPPPITQEEYNELHKQERYGACYEYCKEENTLYVHTIWSLMNRVEELVAEVKRLEAELQQYQVGKNMCGEKICYPPYRRTK